MRTEVDKFLNSLREVSYCDWAIGKKLTEAGGIGKTVYILPARGGGRFPYETLEKYVEEGRDVEVVTVNKHNYPKLSNKDIETIRESARQLELYHQLMKSYQDPVYHEFMR